MRRWRGLKGLVHAAVARAVDLVEEGHESTARAVVRVAELAPGLGETARSVDEIRRAGTAGVLGAIRGVNRLVEALGDAGLDAAERALGGDAEEDDRAIPMRSDAIDGALVADAALALANAAVGDWLRASGNGLDLGMRLRLEDRYLPADGDALREAVRGRGGKVAVFVHGLGTTEWSWCLGAAAYHGDPGASFGSLLERDLGYTPVWVRYNSGRHVSENGRELAARLAALAGAWPGGIDELVLVGHSMGGLVVRSACHYARVDGHGWLAPLRRVFCLGAPHRGAALEKASHIAAATLAAIDTPGTRVSARLIQGRSAGIKDLRHGALLDEDWLGRDPDALAAPELCEVPLLDDVAYYFVSATITRDPEHPLGRLVGDMLVRVPSASGPALREASFRIETRCHGGVLHHELQNHPDVYAELRRVCEAGELGG